MMMNLKGMNTAFIFDLEYRYVVISRGVHHMVI
jgi:hypothetical protein